MKKICVCILVLFLMACTNTAKNKDYIYAGAFEIEKGQDIKDFFDDFEEPLHAHYLGNNNLKWSYAVDDDKIVRYCELKDYKKTLCRLDVYFSDWRVSDAHSNCQ